MIKVLELAIDARARRKLYVHIMSMLRRFLKSYSVNTLKGIKCPVFLLSLCRIIVFLFCEYIFQDNWTCFPSCMKIKKERLKEGEGGGVFTGYTELNTTFYIKKTWDFIQEVCLNHLWTLISMKENKIGTAPTFQFYLAYFYQLPGRRER